MKNPGNREKPGTRHVAPESISVIPANVRMEVADAITRGAEIDPETEGNSGQPSE